MDRFVLWTLVSFNCLHVEDVKANEVLRLFELHLPWFIDQLSELPSGSINRFFLNNGHGKFGATRLLKLRSDTGWMLNVWCGQQKVVDFLSICQKASATMIEAILRNASTTVIKIEYIG